MSLASDGPTLLTQLRAMMMELTLSMPDMIIIVVVTNSIRTTSTKKELKEQNILDKGEVLQSNFNKDYFTKIDIRIDKEIKLYSKSAQIMTSHPAGSYTLQPDANKQYVLRINNPEAFWSTSKYLVVLVK